MSAFERVYSGIKAVMLLNERFDQIDEELKALSGDIGSLSTSHVNLAQRVATIEGYLRGRADQAATQAMLTSSKEKEN